MTNLKLSPAIISIIVVLSFIGVVALLLLRPVALSGDVATIINMLTGTLAAKFGDVVAYHIGSSAGSKEKSDILAKISDGH